MKILFPFLLILTSCTATLRGSFLDIEELTFGPTNQKTEMVKEVITEPATGVVDALDQK